MIWMILVAGLIGALAYVAYRPVMAEKKRAVMDSAARRDMPGALADLSMGATHYQWLGAVRGPVAVCVHGLTTPSFVWRALAGGLGALGYRVLVYDLYGRGYSDRPDGPQTPEVFVRQLDELLADQKVTGEFTLFGFSMGGAIATTFAATYPGRLRQLVLIAPAGVLTNLGGLVRFIARTPGIGDWLLHMRYPRELERGIAAEEARWPASPEDTYALQRSELMFRGFLPSVLASLRGLAGRDFEKLHRKIHAAGVPVLAIWGREDSVIPIEALGRLAEWNRKATQEVIEGAGHGLPYTHADEIIATLSETLNDGLN